MRRRTLANAETHHDGNGKVVLLIANEDKGFGNVVGKLSDNIHCFGASGVETGDVDGHVALDVGTRGIENGFVGSALLCEYAVRWERAVCWCI